MAGGLAVLASHPIQYYGPLFRELRRWTDLHVFFAHRATPQEQARAGFGTPFEWDVDITSGYPHTFLKNVARWPGTGRFYGCNTPEIGNRLREGEFSAVLLMGWSLMTYMQGLFAAKRLGMPVMIRGDSHLSTPRSGLKSTAKALAYPTFLRMFDAALYVGERSRAYYERYGYPSRRLFFSPHCVDTEWFEARATIEREPASAEDWGSRQIRKLCCLQVSSCRSSDHLTSSLQQCLPCRWKSPAGCCGRWRAANDAD